MLRGWRGCEGERRLGDGRSISDHSFYWLCGNGGRRRGGQHSAGAGGGGLHFPAGKGRFRYSEIGLLYLRRFRHYNATSGWSWEDDVTRDMDDGSEVSVCVSAKLVRVRRGVCCITSASVECYRCHRCHRRRENYPPSKDVPTLQKRIGRG